MSHQTDSIPHDAPRNPRSHEDNTRELGLSVRLADAAIATAAEHGAQKPLEAVLFAAGGFGEDLWQVLGQVADGLPEIEEAYEHKCSESFSQGMGYGYRLAMAKHVGPEFAISITAREAEALAGQASEEFFTSHQVRPLREKLAPAKVPGRAAPDVIADSAIAAEERGETEVQFLQALSADGAGAGALRYRDQLRAAGRWPWAAEASHADMDGAAAATGQPTSKAKERAGMLARFDALIARLSDERKLALLQKLEGFAMLPSVPDPRRGGRQEESGGDDDRTGA